MLPINNSDTAWLIVSDYNQENDKVYEDLREDILNPDINHYDYEYYLDIGGFVGSPIYGIGRHVGDDTEAKAGSNVANHVGWSDFGVGGNIYGGVVDFGGCVGDTVGV